MKETISKKEAIITVFGATGKTGRELLKFLSEAELNCQAVTRDLSKAMQLPFVKWVEGGFNELFRLKEVMSGNKSVYLLVPGNDIVQSGKNGIIAAKEAGVEHIVYLSTNLASPENKVPIGKEHAVMEETLINSGINWTILRPVGFMQNWLRMGDMIETIQNERKIYQATGDHHLSFIDARDIAEVAFRVLTDPKKHEHKIYTLTTNKTYSYGDVAEAISEAIGEKVTYIAESTEEARNRLEKKGIPKGYIEFYLKLAKSQTTREAIISGDVKEVLGKPPISVEQFAKDYADSFK